MAAMSSCMKDEINVQDLEQAEANLVGINVAAGTTKGVDVTTSTLEGSTTGVKLHIQDAGTTSDAYDFTASGSDWNQSTTTLKWGEITFPAYFYSMHDGESKSLNMGGSTATLYYEVEDESESSAHKDLVYHASKLNSAPTGGTVNVFHKHALSKISLYAATGGNKLYIARVNLVNIDAEGTVTITHVSTSDATTSTGVSWKNEGTSNESYNYYYIDKLAPSMIQTTATGSSIINSDTAAPLMIIPQTTTAVTSADLKTYQEAAPGSYVEVIYYLTDSEGAAIVGYSSVAAHPDASDYIAADLNKTLYVMGAFPLTYEFEPNKQYDMTLGLGKTGSTGGLLVVDNYVDKDGNPIELTKEDDETITEPQIPEIEPGDEILPGADDQIDITVTVKDWEDGDDYELN